tara:strand:- start:6 stop:359 length:354 start_codon:yes stop_codon:yes gene_type:complete
VLLRHPAAVNVTGASRKDHQFSAHRLLVMLLPVKLRTGLSHGVAVEDPSQNAMNRFRRLIADGPVAVPLTKSLTGRVALQIENRQHEQSLVRADFTEQGAFLQIAIQPRTNAPDNHL